MSLPIVFRDDARFEYDDAADFYEDRREGAGAAFTEAVQKVLDRIAANPKIHGVVRKDVRKAVLAEYPDCVYYRPEPSQIVVISVFHSSRDPAEWQSRI